ncbi:MAG: hypothetical protein AAGE93_21825 [Bacteroidota bacterium]
MRNTLTQLFQPMPFNQMLKLLIYISILLTAYPAAAIVRFDEGRLMINGVQLLQDYDDALTYYYIPQFPRLATKDDGSYELLCMKYIGDDASAASGGLLHALVEFTLPEEAIQDLERQLQEQVPGARIGGQVDLLHFTEGNETFSGNSFEIVSSVLQNSGSDSSLTRQLITSGYAPLTPGSKAAIAAMLDPSGATLLWNSLEGNTSDVSVAVHAYYEAAVKAYQVIVQADMSVAYEHFSSIENIQEGFEKEEIQRVVDEMQRSGDLKIESLDRSAALDVSSEAMEGILQVVTQKLTELMFDAETGWSQEPERVEAVRKNQIPGRQSKGFFNKLFTGSGNQEYVTDEQYVLKRREDIRTNTFRLDLRQNTTVKVPVHTAGNLGGLFRELENRDQYFRIVNLADADFEKREVFFQLDNQLGDAFQDVVNFVAVDFRKSYGEDSEHEDVTKSLVFNRDDVIGGQLLKQISFPRLGVASSDWTAYEYQLTLSLKEPFGEVVLPWQSSSLPAVSINPPFFQRIITVDANREGMQAAGATTAVVDFAVILNGKPQFLKSLALRIGDSDPVAKITLYHDQEEPLAYRVSWYTPKGRVQENLTPITSDYVYLLPPQENLDSQVN